MKIRRRKSRVIRIGGVSIGGSNPVAIQSMVKAETSNIRAVTRQIARLSAAGCEIVRLAVRDNKDAEAIAKIKREVSLPIVADIHFDWRLGLKAIDSGVDKIRLNPGNIYKEPQVAQIAQAAKSAGIPIRIGLNSGSLREGGSSRTFAGRAADAALKYARILEKQGFYDIVISLKASNINDTIEAYIRIARLCDYPLHLGLTATGPSSKGIIKSSIALGRLLLGGIGDTIRVSLTDDPVCEVIVAKGILESLAMRRPRFEIISCPVCGRCQVDLVRLVSELESRLWAKDHACLPARQGVRTRPIKLAVMGCVVNGPGEAKDADLGIAFGGAKQGMLFKKGRAAGKVRFDKCIDVLLKEAERER